MIFTRKNTESKTDYRILASLKKKPQIMLLFDIDDEK